MKRIIIVVACLLNLNILFAQQISQANMIAITPIVSEELSENSSIRELLATKSRQMLTQNGLASYSERFVLTPNLVVMSKDVTATAPPMYSVNFEISFYIIDAIEQTIISEISFPCQGVNRQEHKAFAQGINRINVRTPEVKAFIEKSKNIILSYYRTRIPTMLKQAEALSSQARYDEALALLSGVPESVDGYETVANAISFTYRKWSNYEAEGLLNEAKGYMSLRDYGAAVDALVAIDPLSDHYKTATSMINQIASQINASERAAIAHQQQQYEDKREDALRKHNDQVAVEKMAINAARDIAIAYEEKNSSLTSKVNKWFKSMFK